MKDRDASEVVLDVREAYLKMTALDLFQLLTIFGGVGIKRAGKLPNSIRPKESFNLEKLLELCVQNEGYQVGEFQVFEEVIAWLYPHQDI